jgi:hypothetical protein
MVIIICVLLGGLAIGFTLFVREQDIPPAPIENPELRHLQDRRAVLYENLKDLQFEYHQGKLSDEDYQSLKGGFLYDLAGVMDSIDRMEIRKGKRARPAPQSEPAGPSQSEPAPKGKQQRDQTASANICPSCKGPNPAENRFCGHCGAALRH